MNNLKAKKRDNRSTGQINQLRKSGLIPAILYGGKDPNTKISVEMKSVKNILNSDSFLSTIVELDLDGNKQTRAAYMDIRRISKTLFVGEVFLVLLIVVFWSYDTDNKIHTSNTICL